MVFFSSGKFFTGGGIVIPINEEINLYVAHFHEQRLVREEENKEREF